MIGPLQPADEGGTFFGRSRLFAWAIVIAMFLLALGIRMVDLTNAPLDYQPMRQLRGAIIARAFYLQMLPSADPASRAKATEIAGIMEPQEPPFLERMVALAYLMTGAERPWLVRIVNAIFWLIGGLALFDLARRMTSLDGAVTALAYFLFLPFGITVSRSFQPDAMTVMFLVLTAYAASRWMTASSWAWGLALGFAAGMTVLVKGRMALMVMVILIVAAIAPKGLKAAITSGRVWMIALISFAVPAAYYLLVIRGSTLAYITGTSEAFLGLLLQPSFYVRWLIFLDGLVYLGIAFVSLLGVALARHQFRLLLLSLWVGFAIYGLTLPYTMYTHDYYNLPLVPAIALSLAPLGALLLGRLRHQPRIWQAFAAGAGLLALAFPLWLTRSGMLSKDYRSEHLGWEKIGRSLPSTGRMIGLTHDYGYRLAYFGWKTVATWPGQADYASFAIQGHNEGKDIQSEFAGRTKGYDYFLVTLFSELDAQPALKALLYDHYAIAAQSPDFVLFDLHKPK
jgi:4-amino-4-deoxy-L-arabinose transferase-like glycosyltransferase